MDRVLVGSRKSKRQTGLRVRDVYDYKTLCACLKFSRDKYIFYMSFIVDRCYYRDPQ